MFKQIIKYIKNFFYPKHYGNHVFADFVWNVDKEKFDHSQFAENIFKIMEDSIAQTKMTIVHRKLCKLGIDNNFDTPPGFTSIILIDESHCSSHCYSDRGWLAIDVFTCGNTNPKLVMNYIENQIKSSYPSLKCTYRKNHKRFHF